MRRYQDTEAGMREASIREAIEYAYNEVCPPYLNRKDRRTAKGKMLVAQAEAEALRAELDFLKNKIRESVY